MKLIAITVLLPCADDVPSHVVEWMAANLRQHAANEFDGDYDPSFGDGYEGPPLVDLPQAVVNEPSKPREGQVITDDGDGHFTLFTPFRDDEAS